MITGSLLLQYVKVLKNIMSILYMKTLSSHLTPGMNTDRLVKTEKAKSINHNSESLVILEEKKHRKNI